MNAKQALAQACKRWGKTAGVQDDGPKRASTPQARAAADSEWRAKLAEFKAAAPREKWTKEQRELVTRLMFDAMRYRYRVGAVVLGMFFEVKGEGDSWQDAFLNADHAEALDMERYRNIRAERKAA